jgi:hypothetical protein
MSLLNNLIEETRNALYNLEYNINLKNQQLDKKNDELDCLINEKKYNIKNILNLIWCRDNVYDSDRRKQFINRVYNLECELNRIKNQKFFHNTKMTIINQKPCEAWQHKIDLLNNEINEAYDDENENNIDYTSLIIDSHTVIEELDVSINYIVDEIIILENELTISYEYKYNLILYNRLLDYILEQYVPITDEELELCDILSIDFEYNLEKLKRKVYIYHQTNLIDYSNVTFPCVKNKYCTGAMANSYCCECGTNIEWKYDLNEILELDDFLYHLKPVGHHVIV